MVSKGEKIGPYLVGERVGAGGMATVYKAWHEGLHRFEALKIPRAPQDAFFDDDSPSNSQSSAYVARLLAEARVAAGLRHPNIVAIYNVSQPDAAIPFFAMEWIDGEDLARVLRRKMRFSLEETLEILAPVASALDYAHSQGVIHRDIKPANILLSQKEGAWTPHVVDFGISRAAEEDDGATRLTKNGVMVGTPEYMSPEQAGSGEPVDHRTDLYSLGVVAYEMLCGQVPFCAREGVSRLSILVAHMTKTPPFLSDTDFPRPIAQVLLRVLSKSPDERPQSCASFIEELRAISPEETKAHTLWVLNAKPEAPKDRTPFDQSRFLRDADATYVGEFSPPTPAPLAPAPKPVSPHPIAPTPLSVEAQNAVAPTPEIVAPVAVPVASSEKTEVARAEKVRVKKPVSPLKFAVLGAGVLAFVAAMFAFSQRETETQANASAIKPPIQSAPRVETAPQKPAVSAPAISAPAISAQPKSAPQTRVVPQTRTVRVTRNREIPFQTQTRQTDERLRGERVTIRRGQNGTRRVVLALTMQGEREVARRAESEKTILQPIDEIVEIGTRAPRPAPVVRRARPVAKRPEVAAPAPKRRVVREAPRRLKRAVKRAAPKRRVVREAPLPP